MQEFKTIDARIKEVYFRAHVIDDCEADVASQNKYNSAMNAMAVYNMVIQRVKVVA